MPFTLPPLPYAPDALEPHIDKMTMEIHHDKHHNAYVTNLNKALEGQPSLESLSIEELLAGLDRVPENIRTAVRNNGGAPQSFVFLGEHEPRRWGEPADALAAAIAARFGSFDKFKEEFGKAATTPARS